MSRRRKGRNIHGILLLDKAEGVSSNKALQEVRFLLQAKKAGHTGSLDPLATGLLPLCFGEATKVSAMMLDDDKCYQVDVRLGIMTDTGDREGQVIAEKAVPELTQEQISQCLQHFTGEIEQVPPMYSALKHQGKKLYELAREGKTVERKARRITIFKLILLQQQHDILTLEVHCSKGTYIRSLAEDIGEYLGTCATVDRLRRIAAGKFNIEHALTLEQLRTMARDVIQKQLLAVDVPLESLPAVNMTEEQAGFIRQGQALQVGSFPPGMVRMYCNQDFLGLGEMLLDGKIAPKRLFHLSDEQTELS